MRDPDLVHARPFIRKSVLSPLREYFRYFVDWQHIIAPVFLCIIPGQSLGQSISYYKGAQQGHIWRVPARRITERTVWYEWCVYALSLGSHVWGCNAFVSYMYLMGINTLYHLTIAPDHDTYESAVLNQQVAAGSKKAHDWGEVQVLELQHTFQTSLEEYISTCCNFYRSSISSSDIDALLCS